LPIHRLAQQNSLTVLVDGTPAYLKLMIGDVLIYTIPYSAVIQPRRSIDCQRHATK
jgi:hypothetical protein